MFFSKSLSFDSSSINFFDWMNGRSFTAPKVFDEEIIVRSRTCFQQKDLKKS